jgi:hypothetical protein
VIIKVKAPGTSDQNAKTKSENKIRKTHNEQRVKTTIETKSAILLKSATKSATFEKSAIRVQFECNV